jgi:hypothetical protein
VLIMKSVIAKNVFKFALGPFSPDVRKKSLRLLDDDKKVHFLHIGKCAGASIKEIINVINKNYGSKLIISHNHKVQLSDIPTDSPYFFSVRDPLSRFYSAFYYRKNFFRCSRKASREKNSIEKKMLDQFAEANDLAENLFSDTAYGRYAFSAMKYIKHANKFQHSWFSNIDEIFDKRPPICILRQENLQCDLLFLANKLNVDEEYVICGSRINSTDYSGAPPLSSNSVENLKIWYASDIYFYGLAKSWIDKNQSNHSALASV